MTEDTRDNDKSSKIKEIYRYDEMSNKVLKADKRLQSTQSDPLKDAEMSHPKTMKGRISFGDMGSSVRHELDTDEKKTAEEEVTKEDAQLTEKSIKKTRMKPLSDNSTVLSASTQLQLKYYPTTPENMDIYGNILEWVTTLLGSDMPHDIISGTADILISVLKEGADNADGLTDNTRQTIESDLGVTIAPQEFATVFKLIQSISDYETRKETSVSNDIVTVLENSEDEGQEDLNNLEQEVAMENDEETESDDDITNSKSTQKVARDIPQIETEETIDLSTSSTKIPPISDIDNTYVLHLLKSAPDLSLEEFSKIIRNTDVDDKKLGKTIAYYFQDPQDPTIRFIIAHRNKLSWGMKLNNAPEDELEDLLNEMKNDGLENLITEFHSNETSKKKRQRSDSTEDVSGKRIRTTIDNEDLERLDLSKFKFDQGSDLMTDTKVTLPEGSFKRLKPEYDEIHIPPPTKAVIDYDLVPISTLPDWARKAFPSGETTTLNAVQSKVFPIAFNTDNNMLICAPTGAGKTNVAMLTVLRTLSHYYDANTASFKLKKFKIIYIAPLKALVQEQVREFQRRLSPFGIKVSELTGDSRLTKEEIEKTQILVSTPEKWDIVTRKTDDDWFTEYVKLIIIDEIHLLHDTRGPVLEAIVARTLRSDDYKTPPRIVGLSATLPNYADVATFLRVPNEALFYFDSSYRPCPLSQQFCGVKPESNLKKLNAMNQACYDKVMESVEEGNQVIIFVHSRKETARTGDFIRKKFLETENISKLVGSEAGTKEILQKESDNVLDTNLKKLITSGIGIHHAGLSREDRSMSEDMFADGLLKVLVSTATLAWGVNLPAHTVIIKGTDVYSPEKGDWERLSPQDILQMLGRAGRPRYDTHGNGIIITNQTDIQYYLAVLNQQLPIESQMISKIVDNVNAEIVAGNIKSINDTVDWLEYTYLYVRCIVSPELYNIPSIDNENDQTLIKFRKDLSHTVLTILEEQNLLIYNKISGAVQPTELGRISSYFYINYESMDVYNSEFSETTSLIDIFRIFTLSGEFKYFSVRPEEMRELNELYQRVPIPIKGDVDDPLTKVNILLQAFISNFKLEGFALNADMTFIQQSAGRLIRAMYELCLKKKWSSPTKSLLTLGKCIDKKMWVTNSPLRQFQRCPTDVIKRTESSNLPWTEYLSLKSPSEVGHAIRLEKHGKLVYDLLQKFPQFQIDCTAQPITPSLLNVQVGILPHWIWDFNIHGRAESCLLIVEDLAGDNILYSETLIIRPDDMNNEIAIDFSLQLSSAQQKKLPPNLFLSIISEKWLQCEEQIPIRLGDVIIPKKFPAPTQLADVQLVPTSDVNDTFPGVFTFETFNLIQSNVFDSIYNTNENVFVGCSKGCGKTVIAELAFLNHWRQNGGRIVYICPSQGKIDSLTKRWSKKFNDIAGGKVVSKLIDNPADNSKLLGHSHLTLATPKQFDLLSRRWRQRKNIQNIDLLVCDDVHQMSSDAEGSAYETLISRMMFISVQLEKEQRIVLLSPPLANSRDLSEWVGVKKDNIFNYSTLERIEPITVHFETHDSLETGHIPRSLIKNVFGMIQEDIEQNKTPIIFVSSRETCISVGLQLSAISHWRNFDLVKMEDDQMLDFTKNVHDKSLAASLRRGIGFTYKQMDRRDKNLVHKLYSSGALSILLESKEECFDSQTSNVVVILGTQMYDVRDHHSKDYTANEILEMTGAVTSENGVNGKCLIFTSPRKKLYYRKFLQEPLPTESFLHYNIHDILINGISNSIIESKQDCVDWLTYTYFYRRIHANPTFYGVKNRTEYGISAYLTELIESTLTDMIDISLVEVNDDNQEDEDSSGLISPLNGCLISSHNNVSFATMHTFTKNMSRTGSLATILEILSRANEFENIPLRREDNMKLLQLQRILPLKYTGSVAHDSVGFKIFTLLQAYFSRIEIPFSLKLDMPLILEKMIPLVNALSDTLAGNGFLNATTVMDISQMVIQGVWDVDSPLRQVPFFNDDILEKCAVKKVETVYDIMALEDDDRDEILTMDNKKLTKVATFINNYPNIEMKYKLEDAQDIQIDKINQLTVTIIRDDEPETLAVVSEKYPFDKKEGWWIVVGELSSKELYAMKRVTLKAEYNEYKLEFSIPTAGNHDINVWCICDSYLDADKEVSFEIDVK